MFKKNKKQTETIKEPKEKKVRTVKVGTHKKTVIALWVVLIASVSFGVYKNFTAIDQHTTHEKEIIELRLQDTNGIENFVKNFAKSYYTWNNSKEAIEARTQAINGYLTKELQDLETLYKDTTGQDMPKYYRPPQGIYSEENLRMAQELGYRTVFWSLAYVDWNNDSQPTREQAFAKLLPRTHPGAVVLLHSKSKTNAEILDELLTKWEEEGYRFATVEELFAS